MDHGARAPWSMTLPSGADPHTSDSGPIQWAHGGSGADAPRLAARPREICFLLDLDRRKKMRRVCLLDSSCVSPLSF